MTAVHESKIRALPVPDLSDAGLAELTAELAQYAAEHDRTGEIPWKGLEALHRAGVTTARVPAEHGGPDISDLDAARLVVAVGEGDPSVAIILVNTLLSTHPLPGLVQWHEPTYADYLAKSAQRLTLANFAGAEPEAGASARGGLPATNVRRSGDGWVLNGHKGWVTGGKALDYLLVHVVALEDGKEPQVGFVTLPTDLPGISWLETWDHIGLRASNTHDVLFDNVELPYGAFGAAERPNFTSRPLPASILAHTGLYVGVARAARAAFREFTRSRVPTALGKPIAETDRIQTVAGEIDLQIATAEGLLYGTLLRAASGDDSVGEQITIIKAAISRAVVTATQTAVAALGNPGLTRHNSLERHLRDALCVRVHPPQEDAALLAAGRRVLAG
ncbi:acyl-CoA dehydrogenase family protein [uncultured Jatrophihabitans sp.]|uniref:acyl-CoA dehydrogenase family protein n=1 Tax=uncultured Jatrophihabitans sp. TaxID=1610747 RepID=UPI0035CC72D5